MAYFRCGSGNSGGGGGLSVPTNVWYGTQSQFDDISTKDNNTLYYIQKRSYHGNINGTYTSTIDGIYIGNTKLYPIVKDGWDYVIENVYFPDTNPTGLYNVDYELNTGLQVNSAENKDRDFQIEFKATLSTTASLSGDQLLFGCGTSASSYYSIFREVYLNTSGALCISGNNINDTSYVNDCSGHDMKFIFSRANNSLEIYKDGTLATTLNNIGTVTASDYDFDLGISRYNNNYRFHGTLNYFKFKWLT